MNAHRSALIAIMIAGGMVAAIAAEFDPPLEDIQWRRIRSGSS